MNKKKLSGILTIFFLVPFISPIDLSAETFALRPYTKVSLNDSDPIFRYSNDAVIVGVTLYKLDAFKRLPKADIVKYYDEKLKSFSSVQFDLRSSAIKENKGFTRYYPFSASGKDFIIRIFLTEEAALRTNDLGGDLPVLYEGKLDDPEVTFQILPPLSEILSHHKTEPITPRRSTETGGSA